MNSRQHCTMRQLATHLGVSTATVSRSLRDDPRISKAMRLSVLKAAQKLGYRRDPRMAQLMSHVRATRKRPFQGTLAWVTDHDINDPAERAPHELYWESAEKRAEELGYKLERFANIRPSDAPRLERRLRALGIQGLVIQQFKGAFHLPDWKFNWSHFCILHNGSSQTTRSLDGVDADDVANCVEVFTRLTAMGFRRIGICTTQAIELATSYSLCTAWRRFTLLSPGKPDIPPCLLPNLGPASTRRVSRWLDLHQPDAIVSQVRGIMELLESTGRRVPGDLGLAYQGVNPHGQNTGMWQREDLIARAAIESLIAGVEQGRFGLPTVPRLTLINGTWHPGTTCIARCGDKLIPS